MTFSLERDAWPPGPWDHEPDELHWLTDAGLPAAIRRTPLGIFCGYVGVTVTHPLYGRGMDYDDVADVHVHGRIIDG